MLYIALGIGAFYGDLTHVGHVEETHMFTNGDVFRGDARILIQQGHVKATELHHHST